MASICFVSGEGTELTFPLDKSRPLQIGRDPGNDIVLRDPRVSRQHAEIVFDRGFYIIRDLGSANGTFINGRKIRVAPLTPQVQLKIGSNTGRFIDSPSEIDPSSTLAADLFKATAVDEDSDEFEKRERESLERKLRLPVIGEPPGSDGDPFPEAGPPSTAGDENAGLRRLSPLLNRADGSFEHSFYLLDVSPGYGERCIVRDAEGTALLSYVRPEHLAGFLAGFAAAFIVIGGGAVGLFLGSAGDLPAAFLTLLLTAAFATLVLLLVPRRRNVLIDRDAPRAEPALMICQETQFSVPVLRFSLRTAEHEPIVLLSRTAASVLARHKWRVEHPYSGEIIAQAVESPAVTALLRKVFGSFFGLLRTDFQLLLGTEDVGWIRRRSAGLQRYAIDLTNDPLFSFDRRVAIALAALIDGLERK